MERAFAVNGHEASDVCLVPTIGGAAMKFPTAVESDDAAGAGYHTIQEKAGIATNGIAYTELPTKRLDDFREKEQIINEPYTYVSSKPGKDIRRKLLLACNVWLKVDAAPLDTILHVMSMLHNASLLIDDIQDGSRLRRGAPAAHTVYGIAQTINSANYVYFQAQQLLTTLKNSPTALQIFNEEILNLHRGQGMDLYWRDTLTIPHEEEYLEMVSNKTGGLFRLGIRLMMMSSTLELDLLPLANLLGLLFQIQDDYRNLTCERMSQTKGYCEDFTEGKFSFPIIHAIRNSATGNNEIINILRSKVEDDIIKEHAVAYMRDVTRTFDYTKAMLSSIHNEAKRAMEHLGIPNEAMQHILDSLAV